MQKQSIQLFWRFSNRYKVRRALALLFPVLAVATNGLLAPYLLAQFMTRFQQGGVTLENSWQQIALYGTVYALGEIVLWRLALYFCWTFEIASQRDIYNAIFAKLSRESLDFHANRFGGSLVSQSTKMVGAFERFWDTVIWSFLPMITTIIGAIVILSVLSFWQYALFLLGISIMFISTVFYTSRFMRARNTREAQASTKANGYLADMVTNVATVKAFGRETFEAEGANRHISDWRTKSAHLMWGVIGATSVYSSFLALINTTALVAAIVISQSSTIQLGVLYLLLTYTLNVTRQLWETNSIIRSYYRIIGDAHDMTKIISKEFTLTDYSNDTLQALDGAITFRNVSFTHDDGDGEQVFKNFSLNIPSGQRIGLVGHSGSGKTTLTRVLLRFSDIQSGSIMIDGQDISQVTQQSLHEAISYVPQEPMLFHRSLRENIAYGKPDASDEQIIVAASEANAWDFIQRLPDGLDTLVGERGVKLSGGQRQRIAIARAILKDAPILVLDEATSALDSESEKMIQASLERLMNGRTSIVIAHRLSTIAKLDRIIVLENGHIVEDGTHARLIAQRGVYAKLWSHQSGGFIEEN